LYQLKPQDADIVLEKKYYDLFSNSQFKGLLLDRGIDTVIVTGIYTEVCVFGTVERAFTEGFKVIVPNDLVGSIDERKDLQEASLEIIQNYLATVINSKELI
jgi:nicotinamidase-related amidase